MTPSGTGQDEREIVLEGNSDGEDEGEAAWADAMAEDDSRLQSKSSARREMTDICAKCPVWTGECPTCLTFWYIGSNNKRYGVARITAQAYRSAQAQWDRPGITECMPNLNGLPNVILPPGERRFTLRGWGPKQ